MKRKKNQTDVELTAAPSDIAARFDDPQEIHEIAELEESAGFADEADAEDVAGGGRCGLSTSDVVDNFMATDDAQDFRFLVDRKTPFAFKNGIWQTDAGDKHNLSHLLLKAVRRFCLEVYARSSAPHDSKAHLKSAHFPKAVASLVITEIEHIAFARTFDLDPDLLSLPGGRVVELRTKTERAAKPTDYLSKSTTVAPDFTAPPARFLRFLDEISKKDSEWVAYMLRCLGYFLTGHVSEQFLGFWTGLTSNGKSVLVTLLSETLGDYVATLSLKLLSSGAHEDSEQEMRMFAQLCGARVTFASESSKRLKLDIGLAKKLSSQEKLLGRHLYEDAFPFTPSHKIVISAQELVFEALDFAIKRRLQVVEFPQVFAEPKDAHRYANSRPVDRQLGATLTRERPAILALLIHQSRVWYERGIDAPAVITAKTESFFTDADEFGQWLDRHIARETGCFVSNNHLLASYSAFAGELGIEPLKQDMLSKKLKAAGFSDSRTRSDGHQVRGFVGLRLKPDAEVGKE